MAIIAVAKAAPGAEAEAKADPQYLINTPFRAAGVTTVNPNCKVEQIPFVTQSCTPYADRVCVTNDIETEEIEYEEICKDVVNTVCNPAALPVAAPAAPLSPTIPANSAVQVLRKRREAEAKAQFFAPGFTYPTTGFRTTLTTSCQEVVAKHCASNPKVKVVTIPVESCHTVSKVRCTEVENTVPQTSCEPVTQEVLQPLAYQYGK